MSATKQKTGHRGGDGARPGRPEARRGLTPQRRRVLEAIRASAGGLTLPEAAQKLAGAGVGQATVYRAVKALLDEGLVGFVHGHGGEHRYVALSAGHSHLVVCRGCRKAVEFGDCGLATLEALVALKTGFTVDAHHLELSGVCDDCRADDTASRGKPLRPPDAR
jgi:Fur family transcriptional regulator, ferric uptake regulator